MPGQKHLELPEFFSCLHTLVALSLLPKTSSKLKSPEKMSEEEAAAAAAEPVPEGKEPITLRVRDQVSAGEKVVCMENYPLIHKRSFEIPRPGLARVRHGPTTAPWEPMVG